MSDLETKLTELQTLIKSIANDSNDELEAQITMLKEVGQVIKQDINDSIPTTYYKKSYRLLKNVHLYRSLMIQEVLLDKDGQIIKYGDVFMRGHSLSNITSGAGRTHFTGFTRVCLPSEEEFIDVFGGHNVFYALPKEGNYLYVWGVNTSGCAGTGDTNNIPTPVKVELSFRPSKILSGTSQATGKQTTIILSEDGKVYGAGTNASGELGIGNTINTSTFTQSPYLKDIVDISLASDGTSGYCLAIDKAGVLWSWGFNGSGNLGLNTTTNVTIPAKLEFNAKVTRLSTSVNNKTATSLILLEDNTIRGAGYNAQNQLSQTNTTNSSVFIRILAQNAQELTNIKDIYAAAYQGTCFAIDNDNNLWSWGYGYYGFGDSRSGNNQMASIALENVESLVRVDTINTRCFCAIKDTKQILAFGLNTDSSLGVGHATNIREFENVFMPPNFQDYRLYAFGNEAKLVILANDSIYSCGTTLDGDIAITTSTPQKQI
ncbi:RCC1 domain-containing protein [uncultured Helicobacter sp.]|uniref:RCC1 domain-containing protein n=1 Tax=uncultured Helicobacter sp. TaxID=175537 RepID=UPI00374F8752